MALHDGEQLHWETYKALAEVIKQLRQECVEKREDPSIDEWEKSQLLYRQMTLTDARAAMLEFMVDNMNSAGPKKDS